MAFEWVNAIIPAVEMPQGPYYREGMPVRSDIKEQTDGAKFVLKIRVVDISGGNPLSDVLVDIWHCDAQGRYSGFDFNPDEAPTSVVDQVPSLTHETFLRGVQVTDTSGIVEFVTCFPGWYATRATHIHLKLFDQSKNCLLTTQLYFAGQFTNSLYSHEDSYGRSVQQDTFNQTDTVLALTDAEIDGAWVELHHDEDGTIFGESQLAIDIDARSIRRPPNPDFTPPVGGMMHGKPVR